MATQIEMLRQEVATLEAKHGADDEYVKLLRQQLAGMELNLHNKNERFLISTGEPERESAKAPTEPEQETEEDAIRAEAIRREKVRRMAQDASRRFQATPTATSKGHQGRTRGSSK